MTDKLLSIDHQRSNIPFCAICGIPITPSTTSGWEIFNKDGQTQPVCAICDIEYSKGGKKEP